MLGDLDEDTHLCLNCRRTIVGLDNYIQHRKTHYDKNVTATTTEFTFNYGMEAVHHDDSHDGVVSDTNHIMPSPMHQTEKVNDANKSLTDSYGYHYGLGADVFFSSLNLQSSSKLKAQNVASNLNTVNATECKNTDQKILNQRKSNSDGGHMVDWIDTAPGTSGAEKLMEAVDDISGTKKMSYESPRYNYEYTHDHGSPEVHTFEEEDDDDIEEDDIDEAPPHTHTGGKWKPSAHSNRAMHSTSRWFLASDDNQLVMSPAAGSNEDISENVDDFIPPPSHTKGKWVPGTKIIKLDYKHKERHDSDAFTEHYWCQPCNRKLSSRIVYERHLKSKLHLKRSQNEYELEQVSMPLPRIEDIVLGKQSPDEASAQKRRKRKDDISYRSETTVDTRIKRKRRCNFIRCDVCKTRLRTFLYGKHLISHYHYRRMSKNPTESLKIILKNIHAIAIQSPFQCQPCRFYANTEEMFLRHWNSNEHSSCVIGSGHGQFWCAFCKFVCNTNDQMLQHLIGNYHQEVVMAINRSVPIIIRKKAAIECEKCLAQFSLNIELRKHSAMCSASKALGTASDQYQGKYFCEQCNEYYHSITAYQRHSTNVHSIKSYFCGPCGLSFHKIDDAKRHRVSAEHKIKTARMKSNKRLKRKCFVCDEILDDLLLLKEHLKTLHPNHNYSCYFCGRRFILPQELSRHIRDKVCKTNDDQQHHSADGTDQSSDSLNPMLLLDLPIVTDIKQDTEIIMSTNTDPSPIEQLPSKPLLLTIDNQIVANVSENTSDTNAEGSTTPVQWGCKQCEFRTQTEAECIFHEMLHKWDICNNEKIPCPICNRMFGKNSLRCHLRVHTNERIFECDHCKMKFTRKSNLKEHIHRIHLKRPVVKKSTPSTSTANRLAKKSSVTPSNELCFDCSICMKRFKSKRILDQHMYCHREVVTVKVFKCTENACLFTSRTASELRVHQTTHFNDKNFACTFEKCQYKTKTQSLLNRHVKAQHEAFSLPLFKCAECSFTSKISSHYRRHQRIHTGEKPYKCPHCDYACNNPENLRKHVITTKKHVGRYLFECAQCPDDSQRFVTNNSKEYKFHLVTVHKHDAK